VASERPDPRETAGTPLDADALVEDVYGELRRLADAYLRRERAKTIQATELVHEAFLRLQKERRPAWKNRTHFLAIAAISMRRLLVERARARRASKRGGGLVQVTLDDRMLAASGTSIDLIAIDAALSKLSAIDPTPARVVELRYFGGMTVEDTAEALNLSPATVKRHWTFARAWLFRELREGGQP